MIEVQYRFLNDPPRAKTWFRCDKPQQYDIFMKMYGHNIEVISDSTRSYDSPVAMPIPVPWWYGPGDHGLLKHIPKEEPRCQTKSAT